MPNREDFLAKICTALGRSPSVSASLRAPSLDALPEVGKVLPGIPVDQLVSYFESELRKVAVQPHRVISTGELRSTIAEILRTAGAGPIVLSRNPILQVLRSADLLSEMGEDPEPWPASNPGTDSQSAFQVQCFNAKAGITGVDFALAESGSLIVSSQTEGSQLTSLAPPIHIALYRRNQVVENLEEVLDRHISLHGSGIPGRSAVFITGTSRTADIEQITIRGVHGPQQVHAILVEDSCIVV